MKKSVDYSYILFLVLVLFTGISVVNSNCGQVQTVKATNGELAISITSIRNITANLFSRTEFNAIEVDSIDDSIYIVGQKKGINEGENKGIIYKFSMAGSLQLNITFPNDPEVNLLDVLVDSEHGLFYVVGTTGGESESNGTIMKYETDGTFIDQHSFGGQSVDEYCAITTNSLFTEFYVSGRTASYGEGEGDILAAKYSSDLELIWNQSWGNPHWLFSRSLAYDEVNDEIYVSGSDGGGSFEEHFYLVLDGIDGTISTVERWNATVGERLYPNIMYNSNNDSIVLVSPSNDNISVQEFETDGSQLWEETILPPEDKAYFTKDAIILDMPNPVYAICGIIGDPVYEFVPNPVLIINSPELSSPVTWDSTSDDTLRSLTWKSSTSEILVAGGRLPSGEEITDGFIYAFTIEGVPSVPEFPIQQELLVGGMSLVFALVIVRRKIMS